MFVKMASDGEASSKKKLNELLVKDLKIELEKRKLDSKGVKNVLLQRLQKAVEEEGKNVEEYLFNVRAATPSKIASSEEKVSVENGSVDESDSQALYEAVLGAGDGELDGDFGEDFDNVDALEASINEQDESELLADAVNILVEEGEKVDIEENEVNQDKSTNGKNSSTAAVDASENKGEEQTTEVESEPTEDDGAKPDTDKVVSGEDSSFDVHIVENDELDADLLKNSGKEGTAEPSTRKTDVVKKNAAATDEKPAQAVSKKTDTSANSDKVVEKKEVSKPASSQKGKPVATKDAKVSSKSDEKDHKTTQSSGKNLWVSSLSPSTRATDLKGVFSKHGKVVGAKVVTSARTPGARCYGFVTMSTPEETTKCIQYLHRTELHGRMISVERAKNDPGPPKRADGSVATKSDNKTVRTTTVRSTAVRKHAEKRSSTDTKKHDAKKDDKSGEKSKTDDKPKDTEAKGEKEKTQEEKDKERKERERRRYLSLKNIQIQRAREKERERERLQRQRERRQRIEGERERRRLIEVERRNREEARRLNEERERLRLERERLEREKMEAERLERERIRLERERRERERLERERDAEQRRIAQLRAAKLGSDAQPRSRYEDRRALKRSLDQRDSFPDRKRPNLAPGGQMGNAGSFPVPEGRFNDFDHRSQAAVPADNFERRVERYDRREGKVASTGRPEARRDHVREVVRRDVSSRDRDERRVDARRNAPSNAAASSGHRFERPRDADTHNKDRAPHRDRERASKETRDVPRREEVARSSRDHSREVNRTAHPRNAAPSSRSGKPNAREDTRREWKSERGHIQSTARRSERYDSKPSSGSSRAPVDNRYEARTSGNTYRDSGPKAYVSGSGSAGGGGVPAVIASGISGHGVSRDQFPAAGQPQPAGGRWPDRGSGPIQVNQAPMMAPPTGNVYLQAVPGAAAPMAGFIPNIGQAFANSRRGPDMYDAYKTLNATSRRF